MYFFCKTSNTNPPLIKHDYQFQKGNIIITGTKFEVFMLSALGHRGLGKPVYMVYKFQIIAMNTDEHEESSVIWESTI